jgi:uncharacterized protein YndB with AHSA1/START domain
VLDMAPVWAARRDSEREWVAPGEPLWFPALRQTLPVSPATTWAYLVDRDQRQRWVEGMTGMTVDGGADGRLGAGAVMHCAHGKETLDFEIVEWRPFDSLSMDLVLPLGVVIRTTFELTETADGTRCEMRLRPVREGKGALARAGGKLLLAVSRGKISGSMQRSVATLAKIVADDLAAGQIEHWQPVARAA